MTLTSIPQEGDLNKVAFFLIHHPAAPNVQQRGLLLGAHFLSPCSARFGSASHKVMPNAAGR